MYYRSNCPDGMRIGVARCDRLTADEPPRFYRFIDHPLFEDHPELHVEDPFVWHNGENFEMIAKDMNGNGCGVVGGGRASCVGEWSRLGLRSGEARVQPHIVVHGRYFEGGVSP